MDAKKLARQTVLTATPYQPGKPVEELKREMKLKTAYKMASNENPLGPSPRALSALKKAMPGINRYPDGGCYYLRKALSAKYKVPADNIVLGNGSDEIIVMTLRAFINKGDEVIVADPTFLIYKLAARLCEADIISVPLKAFRYDLAAMREKVTPRTKVVFIANPDNPTGSYVTKAEVASFLKALPSRVLVFFDEAYSEYVEEKDYPDILRYLTRGNVIVCRTFSKVYGLAGLRVGWAAGSRDVISCLNRVREPFNVGIPAQVAAEAALQDKAHIERSRSLVREWKKYFCEEFKKLNLFFVPSVTNFVLVNVDGDSTDVYRQLLRKGIIVRDMSGWGLNNFIRVTVGLPKENRLFVKELKKILSVKKEKNRDHRTAGKNQ